MSTSLVLHRAACATALLAALGVAGCGGGGGDEPPPPPTQVTITAANQDIVATTTANVFVGFGGSSAVITGKDGSVSVKPASSAAPSAGALLTGSARHALLTAAPGKGDAPRALQAISSATQNCPTSGTVTATVDDADNNGVLSVGDTVTLLYAQCRDGADVLNGSVSMTFTRIVDGPSMAELSASMTFGSLTATSGDFSSAMNGTVSIAMTMTSTVVTSTITVGSGGLTNVVNSVAPAYNETLTMAAGLTFREIDDATLGLPGSVNPGMASMWVDGSVSSSRFGGQSISIATVTPMQAYVVNPYPHAGQIMVSGAAGTRLRMTGVDSASVRLELDYNGDGIFEMTTIKPWGDIM